MESRVEALYRSAEAQLDSPAAWWRLGSALAERAHIQEERVAAIVALRHAASLPADDAVLGQIAGTFVALGEYEAAYRNLARARRATAGAQDYWRVTRFLLEAERSADALGLLQRAAEVVDTDDDLRLLRAVALAEAQQLELAMIEVEGILAQRPELLNALELRATLLAKQGRTADGIRAWREVVRIHPAEARAVAGFGLALLAGKQYVEAIETLQRAVAEHPWSAELHLHCATALREAGRLDAAEGEIRRALELDTEAARTHHELGLVLEAAGRHAEAARALRDALVRAGGVRSVVVLARVLEADGHADEAQSTLVQALVQIPRTDAQHGELTAALDALRMRNLSGEGIFAGSLAAFSVWQVLELMHQHRSTGRLELVLTTARADIFLRDGALLRVHAADAPALPAKERIFQILGGFVNRQDGSFAFRPQPVDDEPGDLALGVQGVLLELARLQDEAQRQNEAR